MESTRTNILPILYDADLPQLERLIGAWGLPAFRARQIYRQLYVNLAAEPEAMSDLPLALRRRLAIETRMGTLQIERVQTADEGLTRKALFRLPGGALAETVLMVYPDRATVCVSTQAGCAMGCVFCATGKLGLLRNLSTGEIVEQVLWAARELHAMSAGMADAGLVRRQGDQEQWWADEQRDELEENPSPPLQHFPTRISNVVFMGMGEPFANYERWWAAVERLHDPQGFNLGARSMTVSTVGLIKGIRRLAEERLPINLAISLHAPDDRLRSELMPINEHYPIAELLAATHAYIEQTGRRVSFEYVLLQGRNDHPHQALALAKLLKRERLLCHVNLIPWNPVPGMPLGRSERKRVRDFQQILHDYGIACTVRVERGVAIAAACGQLAGIDAEQSSQITTIGMEP